MPTSTAPTVGGRDNADGAFGQHSRRRENDVDDESTATNPMRGWGGLSEAVSPPRNYVNAAAEDDDAALKTMTMTPQLNIPSFLKKAKPKKVAATPVCKVGKLMN